MPITDNPPTPTPWKYGHFGNHALWIGPEYDRTPVAMVDHDTDHARDNSRANAAFIVRAVNSHTKLVSALEAAEKFILDWCADKDENPSEWEIIGTINAALILAESSHD